MQDGDFWIALSALDADVQSNLSLLKDRDSFDLPLVYDTGQRAILTFEKGVPGDRALTQAMTAWPDSGPGRIAAIPKRACRRAASLQFSHPFRGGTRSRAEMALKAEPFEPDPGHAGEGTGTFLRRYASPLPGIVVKRAVHGNARPVRRERQAMTALRALGVAVVLVVIWQAIVTVFQPPPFLLPDPARMSAALVSRPELWRVHAVTTLTETLIGLASGAVLGAGLALTMSFLPLTRPVLLPVMVVSQAIPVFAIAPLLALWFGFGIASKIVMATIAIFFPVASAFADGLSRTNSNLLDLGRLYRARRWQVVVFMRLPGAKFRRWSPA